ncbi:MAG: hypothetical protein GF344_19060 [Chitinivibrionales bacterium]|nr:hypothetical protein [Chitinivibrionales bacterium]MBD3358727.1 hypothetical protein [Chitinivibrionales bacterium]
MKKTLTIHRCQRYIQDAFIAVGPFLLAAFGSISCSSYSLQKMPLAVTDILKVKYTCSTLQSDWKGKHSIVGSINDTNGFEIVFYYLDYPLSPWEELQPVYTNAKDSIAYFVSKADTSVPLTTWHADRIIFAKRDLKCTHCDQQAISDVIKGEIPADMKNDILTSLDKWLPNATYSESEAWYCTLA